MFLYPRDVWVLYLQARIFEHVFVFVPSLSWRNDSFYMEKSSAAQSAPQLHVPQLVGGLVA
jgi:predicted alpha/beta superfamily hydrolase